jgi:hypothetical protein
MTHSQATASYLGGLVICGACALFLISQISSPPLDIVRPPSAGDLPPVVAQPPTSSQVTGVPPVIDLVPRAHVQGGLTPTPATIAPPQPTQSAPKSPVTTSTPRPVPTTRPAPTRAPSTTSAPRPPVVKPPALPPVKVPNLSPVCNGINVLSQVTKACNDILGAVSGITSVGGRGSRPDNPTSCHPLGLALDLMVGRNRVLGDLIYAYVKLNKTRLGITTILWRVPDHYDHVHLSFAPCNH